MLWSFGLLLLLPMAVAPIGLFVVGLQRISARQWLDAAGHMLGSLVAACAWLAAAGYCAYRAYLAIP